MAPSTCMDAMTSNEYLPCMESKAGYPRRSPSITAGFTTWLCHERAWIFCVVTKERCYKRGL